jgi:hypothetical protein
VSKRKFDLRIEEWVEIHELPDAWPTARLREVLERADFDDAVTDDEVAEMAVMALQDQGEQKAGELVLEVVFGDAMGPGVRQNLIDDLRDDRPWEHFAGVDKQAGLFDAVVLLQRAFPPSFGVPDAIRLRLEVAATDAETSGWLCEEPSSSLLLRLLASGMEDDAVLKRLYESELASDSFPASGAILWRVREVGRSEGTEPVTRRYDIHSSCQWLGPLESRQPWQGVGWPDGER